MRKNILTAVSFFALFTACVGQTSYKGLTPGSSTRAEVERVLGRPVKQVSPTLIEYAPQPPTGRIFVQYRDDESNVIERLEFLCRAAGSSCDNLIRSLKLSTSVLPRSSSSNGDSSGKTVRYYYAPEYFATTIDNESEGSYYSLTPARVALYSPELYAAAIAKAEEEGKKEAEQLTVTSLRFLFESADESVPIEERAYRRRFSGEGTRFINYEITLSYPRAKLGKPISITAVWSRDAPMQPVRLVLDNKYDELFTFRTFNQGVGNVDGRQFSQRHGQWTVELYIEGQRVAVGSFEIY